MYFLETYIFITKYISYGQFIHKGVKALDYSFLLVSGKNTVMLGMR